MTSISTMNTMTSHPLPRSVEEMNRVSPRLAIPSYVGLIVWSLIFGAVFTFAALRWSQWWFIGLGVVAVSYTHLTLPTKA